MMAASPGACSIYAESCNSLYLTRWIAKLFMRKRTVCGEVKIVATPGAWFIPNRLHLKEIRMNSDHADEELVAEPNPLGTITAMAIDPSDSRIIYAAAGDKKNGVSSLFVSHDAAANWMKQENLPGVADRLWVNPHSPKNARTLFLAGAHFLIEKTSTESKKLSIPNVKALADISIGFTPEGHPIFYVVGDESAFVSDDEARTWRKNQTWLRKRKNSSYSHESASS